MHRARPGSVKQGEGAGDGFGQVGGAVKGARKGADCGAQTGLILHLVQVAATGSRVAPGIGRRDDQQGNAVSIGLAHGGGDIGKARPGDDETDAGLARHPRIAIGHKAQAALMPCGYVP